MNSKILWVTLALALLGAGLQALAQDAKTPYPTMAPLGQYLMDRDAEIALARSAAPEAISRDAEVAVLGQHGYETVAKGKNGFVCIVERAWMSSFDDPGFWNPRLRGPICYNPPASQTILPLTFKRTELVLAGLTKAEVIEGLRAFGKKELRGTGPGAMSFMLSKAGYLGDAAGHWLPHLMFFVPQTEASAWGADVPGSPVFLGGERTGAPEPVTEFLIPVPKWSDGTPAPADVH